MGQMLGEKTANFSAASSNGVKPMPNKPSASSLPSISNISQYTASPEQLLLKAMQTSQSTYSKQTQHQSNQVTHNSSMTQSQSIQTSASKEVLEHQKKIEMERQKQMEYEANQRRIVIEKDAHRNLIPKQI